MNYGNEPNLWRTRVNLERAQFFQGAVCRKSPKAVVMDSQSLIDDSDC